MAESGLNSRTIADWYLKRKQKKQAKLLKKGLDVNASLDVQLSWFDSQKDSIKSKAFPILAAHWIVKQGGIFCGIDGCPAPLFEAMKPQFEAFHKLNKIMSINCSDKENTTNDNSFDPDWTNIITEAEKRYSQAPVKSATTVTPPPYNPMYPVLPEQCTSSSKPLTQPQALRSNGPVDKMYIASAQAAPIITRSKTVHPNRDMLRCTPACNYGSDWGDETRDDDMITIDKIGPELSSPVIKKEGSELMTEERPFTPGERQAILTALPPLKRQDPNTEFWRELDSLVEAHQMTLRDIHTIVKAKIPRDRWERLPASITTAQWIDLWVDDQGRPLGLWQALDVFRREIQEILGSGKIPFTLVTLIKQKDDESPDEYALRKWNAYERWALCAKKQPDRDDVQFIDTLVDGLGPKYQQALSLGVNPGETFDQIMQWAGRLEMAMRSNKEEGNKPYRRGVATAQYNKDTKNKMVFCSNCGKRGHVRRDCWAKGGGAEGQGPSFKQVSTKDHNENSQEKTLTEAQVRQLIEGIMRPQ